MTLLRRVLQGVRDEDNELLRSERDALWQQMTFDEQAEADEFLRSLVVPIELKRICYTSDSGGSRKTSNR